MEGRSTGGELVACVNEVPEPAALRGLHRLDDDVVVPPVRADLGNAVEVRILQGAVSSLFSCAGTSGSRDTEDRIYIAPVVGNRAYMYGPD